MGTLQLCKDIVYPISDLPTASIIICFHNEALSTLLRTVYSVLDRSPLVLVHEIILVDDGSTYGYIFCLFLDFLKESLQEYVDLAFRGKVRILRTEDRVGLIKARLFGADKATGEVLIFLDSHCEATEGSDRTPTIAGGLFAIMRERFIEIGKYDPGMDIWGAENLEISFRNLDYGDISERLEIRKRLKCHSFEWYLNNVYPSMFNPEKSVIYGEVV
ncbi:polypeptide N-acetylgalactosaminyltransferase 11-like [Octopus sinensis]|uniref:Polypeptide N-acetylgalactosaminyltransferase 11-like n=1 Tax=Octopus sinensis TaxID=2607531 RepID=A0A7E6EGT3_9MOLL|nr:polypeptide N-acetylgalactosaminyltransferase 11-like [Octopus sinensis]